LPKSLTPPETQDSTETGPTPDSRPNDGDTGPPPETKGDAEASSGRADPTSGTETATGPDESAIATSTDDGDDVEALRRELNDQFESIKILEPGQYELNLMELYNREERIIALKEDGQYVIDVPDTWLGDDDGS
jgi:predicted  nucleic acid-binding Zn-ribbon protein